MNLEELIKHGRNLRAKLKRLDDKHKEIRGAISQQVDANLAEIQRVMNETGQLSARTAAGTVVIQRKKRIKLDCWDDFIKYVADNQAWHMLTKAANTQASRDVETETGSLPPGVGSEEYYSISLRAPTNSK